MINNKHSIDFYDLICDTLNPCQKRYIVHCVMMSVKMKFVMMSYDKELYMRHFSHIRANDQPQVELPKTPEKYSSDLKDYLSKEIINNLNEREKERLR